MSDHSKLKKHTDETLRIRVVQSFKRVMWFEDKEPKLADLHRNELKAAVEELQSRGITHVHFD